MSTEDLTTRLRDIAESEAVRGFMVAEDLAAIRAAADALEDATASLDARWEHSDHLTAKYYQRMRAAERDRALTAAENAEFLCDNLAAESKITRALELHKPRKVWESDRSYTLTCTSCVLTAYPCATARILTEGKTDD